MAEKQIGIRLDARTIHLVEIAMRATGKKFATVSDYIRWTLELSFQEIKIVPDEKDLEGNVEQGKTLSELAETLYQGNEALQFLALVQVAPWLMSEGESKLERILRHSDYFAPSHKGALHEGRVQQHWATLAAIRDGEVDIDILPEGQRPKPALAFGLLGDAERIALYKSSPKIFKAQSEAYKKAMKER